MHQMLVEQSLEPIERTHRQETNRIAHRLGRLQAPATREDRQTPKQQLLAQIEQTVAPVDRRPQRALAFG
jgi:hypothetical protein